MYGREDHDANQARGTWDKAHEVAFKASQEPRSCPAAGLASVVGLIALAPLDVGVAAADIFVAPSVVGEVALLSADVGVIYANGYLISIAQKAQTQSCDEIHLDNPINPFGG
jgi:hypothetical protein